MLLLYFVEVGQIYSSQSVNHFMITQTPSEREYPPSPGDGYIFATDFFKWRHN